MRYGNCLGGYYGHGMFNYWHGSGMVIGLGIIVVIALLFIFFVHNKRKSNALSEAEETLKMRYVNGEISEEEYQKMKKMIR